MMFSARYAVSVAAASALAFAQQNIYPAAIPLAVRSPYLSAWMASVGNDTATLPVGWPTFWTQTDNPTVTWVGHIRVDGQLYQWFNWDRLDYTGPIYPNSNYTGIEVTPTRTIFYQQAGPVNLTATFLNPIEASDWAKQSLPFTYLALDVTSRDGAPHDVAVYSDISGEWLSANRSQNMIFNVSSTAQGNWFYTLQLEYPQPMTEIADQAEDTVVYFAMSSEYAPMYDIDNKWNCRSEFDTKGSLPDSILDTDIHNIDTPWFPGFAFASDLGSITNKTVFWALGLTRDPAIMYSSADGSSEARPPLWRTQYDTSESMVDDVLADFSAALARATALDERINESAAPISSEYASVVSFAAHQAFGAIEITVGQDTGGQFNISDIKTFMKEMGGSPGDDPSTGSRVTPVEVLYASFPIFLYVNASLCKTLLAPLLEQQDSPSYALSYAARDMGLAYPIADGDSLSHQQGVEQSGNMLIMTLAHARFTGDGSLLGLHYNLLRRWAEYLVNNTETLTNQEDADYQAVTNMTNLALKGIIGIRAMSDISTAVGQIADAEYFANTATQFLGNWDVLSSTGSQSYLPMVKGNDATWALMYNLYPDLLLGTNLVSEKVYQSQCTYYESLNRSAYGLGINSVNNNVGNSAWLSFTASTCYSNDSQRDYLLAMVIDHANNNATDTVFSETYTVDSGAPSSSDAASPALGAVFAPLALTLMNKTITIPPMTSSSTSGGSDSPGISSSEKRTVGSIPGAVAGSVSGVIVLVLIGWCCWRQVRLRRSRTALTEDHTTEPFMHHISQTSALPVTNGGGIQTQYVLPLTVSGKNQLGDWLENEETQTPISGGEESSRSTMDTVQQRLEDGGSSAISDTDVVNLRAEMANLRRVVQSIQSQDIEPPPQYVG